MKVKSSRLLILGACIAIVVITAVLVMALSPSITAPIYRVTVENKDIKDVGFM